MKTVLIVEDEKMIRQGIKVMVQRCGVPVETIMECNNGEVALDILKSQKVDMMFTDIRMPKMDGIELVKELQKLPGQPFIVAVSGYDDFSYAVEMLRNGVREYILKPVDRDKIKAVMEKAEMEIVQAEADGRQQDRIGCQQLKYMLLNPNISETEIRSVANQFEKQLLDGDYFVCCANEGDEDIEIRRDYLYLGEVDAHNLYIIRKEKQEEFLEAELQESCVGISGVHRGVGELRTAYEEAVQARREAFCRGKRRVEFRTVQAGVPLEVDIEKIAQMTGTDKVMDALKQLEQMNFSIRHQNGSTDSFEEYIHKLTGELHRLYGDMTENVQLPENPYTYAEIDSFMEEYTGAMIGLNEKLDKKAGEGRNRNRIKEAISYMEENFDHDLNMAVVSNYVSMNYSLFSFAFKEVTGENFVGYLKKLRMDKAKKLLTETELRVVEVSQRVGYENEKHFMKLFKKEYGVSPTEYRKNMKIGQNISI